MEDILGVNQFLFSVGGVYKMQGPVQEIFDGHAFPVPYSTH